MTRSDRSLRSAPLSTLIAALFALSAAAFVGCGGDDDEAPAPAPSTGPMYALGGYFIDPDGNWIAYLATVDDLSAAGEVDVSAAIEFPDDMVYGSPGDGAVYVGNGGKPVIEKWVLGESGRLEKAAEMGIGQYGIETGLGALEAMHFVSPEKAYFIDPPTLQAVVWNPSTMETIESISLEGFAIDGMFNALSYVHRDGDRLLIWGRYWREDDTAAPLTRLAFLDTKTDAVTYVDDDRCGNVTFEATDTAGNLYLASHPVHSASVAVGAAGDPAAATCILRVKAGADGFDPDYMVDLNALVDGVAATIMPGPGDTAFILVWEGEPFTVENFFMAHRLNSWAFHSIVLGDEANTLTRVPGIPLQGGYASAFTTDVDGVEVPFMVSVDGDYEKGTLYDMSDPSNFVPALEVPGYPGTVIRLR